jgi:putative thiamine transport system permease protein
MPLADASAWQRTLADVQMSGALRATIVSALGSTLLATALAAVMASRLFLTPRWLRFRQRLPLLLSTPHAAFAIGMLFIISPTGWVARLFAVVLGWDSPPDWVTVHDANGIALAAVLAFKESWFLLWTLAATLGEADIARQLTIAASLGYRRSQVWHLILWPQIAPRMAWPIAAVLAYSLSVVDVAIIVGPTNPPTLAIVAWQWLTDADALRQAQGVVASLVLLGLMGFFWAALWALYCAAVRWRAYPKGVRRSGSTWGSSAGLGHLVVGVGYLSFATLLVWSFAAQWFFPALWPEALTVLHWRGLQWDPFRQSLLLAFGACSLCLPLALLWLEWGAARSLPLLYVPLLLPAMPLAAAQYFSLLHLGLDGTLTGVLWSHSVWVLPYMVLSLAGPYGAQDPRAMTIARSLGIGRWQACLRVKWPMLLRPIMASLAIGFSVSIALYLPTIYGGAGRFATVTTEAVALSAQGHRSVLAVQAMLQLMLPMAAFAVAIMLPRFMHRHRRGLQ